MSDSVEESPDPGELVIGLASARPAPPTGSDGGSAPPGSAPPGSAPPGSAPPGSDGRARCRWGASTIDYAHYHDTEWGRATVDERTLFEKMCLEGFQSGLSWLTVLRKREAFRAAFVRFEAADLAHFGPDDVTRLLGDPGIIRHRGKIEAAIGNARALVTMWETGETLADLIWGHEPPRRGPIRGMDEVPAQSAESMALSRALKRRGFRFVGPTTAYAAMQAMGVVNDHLGGCWVREDCEASRRLIGGAPMGTID